MTEKVNLGSDWQFREAIEDAIRKNVINIPWEGEEIDVQGAVDSILDYLQKNHYSVLRHNKNPYK